jgi:hypothetical protein
MKSNKLAFAVIVAALTLQASNAKALILGRFEKLNFSLIAAQQELENSETSSNVFVSTIKTSKITNKDLLSFLATTLNTNWPDGAQLALGEVEVTVEGTNGLGYAHAAIRDIFVVDKTGTNPVFDVSTGINVGDTNIVYFSMDSDPAVFRSKVEVKGKLIAFTITNEIGSGIGIDGGSSGTTSDSGSNFGKIFFHLFEEQNGITNTDLCFEGLNAIEFHSNTVYTTNKITEYEIRSEQAPVTGDGTFNDEWTVVKGKVTGSMEWKENLIPFPGLPIIPTNWPPPILFTNIPIRLPTNPPPLTPFTNIIIITNVPLPITYPTTNPPPPIIILNP